MKVARYLVALSLVLAFATFALAQSGRRPVYQPNSSSSSANPGNANTTATNGTCPQVTFPGEYGNGGLSTRSSSSTQSANSNTNANGEEVLKIDTTLVSLPVTVLDRNGKFIPYLTRCDFHIYEDGVMQEVTEFAAVQAPFHVVLLLDTSGSTAFKIEDMHDAAIAFTNQLRPDDRVMVVSFDSRVRVLAEFTSDRAVLRDAIRSTHNGGSTKLYDAVDEVITQHLSRVQGRKAIVLFSDGVDTSSRTSDRSTLELVEESNVLVYPIQYDTSGDMRARGGYPGGGYPGGRGGRNGRVNIPPIYIPGIPGGRRWPLVNWATPPQIQIGRGGGGPEDYERANRYMRDLATHSGGTYFKGDTISNVSDAFVQIAEELRHQYSLGYYPTNANNDGTVRRLKVRVSQAGWIVKAKESYRAAGTAATNSDGSTDRPVLKRRNFEATN